MTNDYTPASISREKSAITSTTAIKRVLRAAGLPLVTQKEWCKKPGLLVTSRSLPTVMIDKRNTDTDVLRAALDALRAAGAPCHDEYMVESGFISIYPHANDDDKAGA